MLAAALAADPTEAYLRPVHILQACQNLTRLELRCFVIPGLPALAALPQLPLRHLQCAVECPHINMDPETMSTEQQRLCTLPDGMWQGLRHLTHLDLGQQVCWGDRAEGVVGSKHSLSCLVWRSAVLINRCEGLSDGSPQPCP